MRLCPYLAGVPIGLEYAVALLELLLECGLLALELLHVLLVAIRHFSRCVLSKVLL